MGYKSTKKACKAATVFCTIVLLMTIATGCSGSLLDIMGSDNTTTTNTNTGTYSDDKYTYAAPMEIENTYVFEEKLGFNPYLDGAPYVDDIVSLFEDAALTRLIDIQVDFEGMTGKEMTIKPGSGTSILTDSVYQGSDFEIDNWDPTSHEGTWGLYEQLYMVQWCDYKTGDPLDKPVVTAVSVKSDLPATTNLQYFATEDGAAGFRWNPVPGAEKYYIVRLDYTASEEIKGGAYLSYAKFIGESTEPQWICDNGTPGPFESINEPFYNSNYMFEESNQSAYSVVAISGSSYSPLSGQVDDAPISSTLPHQMISTTFLPTSISGIPAMVAVSMCNTDTRYLPIDYDTENMYIANDAGHAALFLPFTVAGTPFGSEFNIVNINPATYQQELEEVLAINKGIQSRTGSIAAEVIDDVDTPSSVSTERPEVPDKVFATNPMTDFIAANLIAGNYAMSLEGFANNTDSHFVMDAFGEARYQNPLVLYADQLNYNSSTKTLVVVPSNDVDMAGIAEKQEAIRAEAKRVIAEIIQPGMSDLEKEMAINQYLCETGC